MSLALEQPIEEWFMNEPYSKIPAHMQEAIMRYIFDRVKPGDFLTAVLENNLQKAVGHADEENIRLLGTYVQFFYNQAPASCSGSPAAVKDWLTGK